MPWPMNRDFKYDWERPYLEGSWDRIFRNTFADIAYILESCSNNGTRFEIECYDISHLYTAPRRNANPPSPRHGRR